MSCVYSFLRFITREALVAHMQLEHDIMQNYFGNVYANDFVREI